MSESEKQFERKERHSRIVIVVRGQYMDERSHEAFEVPEDLDVQKEYEEWKDAHVLYNEDFYNGSSRSPIEGGFENQKKGKLPKTFDQWLLEKGARPASIPVLSGDTIGKKRDYEYSEGADF